MTKNYQHTQIGYATIVPCMILLLFLAPFVNEDEINRIVLMVLVLVGILFGSLTVTIDHDFLKLYFGPGIIHKKFALNNITSCEIVRNHWYYGWGIRLTPHGWLFSVSGLDAVEITMKNGKRYGIGTNDALNLQKAILKYKDVNPK